eukprot:gene8092-8927_t
MSEVESKEISRYSFGCSELRGLSPIKKAVLVVSSKKVTLKEAQATYGIKISAISRGRIAQQEGRDIGKNGRPGLLNQEDTAQFVRSVRALLDDGEDISYEIARHLAEAVFLNNPKRNLEDGLPNFTTKWIRRIFEAHNIDIPQNNKRKRRSKLANGSLGLGAEGVLPVDGSEKENRPAKLRKTQKNTK